SSQAESWASIDEDLNREPPTGVSPTKHTESIFCDPPAMPLEPCDSATVPADRLGLTQGEPPCLPGSLERDPRHASCLGGTQEALLLLAQAPGRKGRQSPFGCGESPPRPLLAACLARL